MVGLVTPPPAGRENLIGKGSITAVHLSGVDPYNGSFGIIVSNSYKKINEPPQLTILLVHFSDSAGVAAAPDDIMPKFREVCCSCELGPRNMIQRVQG